MYILGNFHDYSYASNYKNKKSGEQPFSYATFVANEKIHLDIAELDIKMVTQHLMVYLRLEKPF